ncbi:hypothetical protein [Flavobacterium cyanobacteriorum]|nr:hypothetical protein [Flavobacterium cyanobacteriorum]
MKLIYKEIPKRQEAGGQEKGIITALSSCATALLIVKANQHAIENMGMK